MSYTVVNSSLVEYKSMTLERMKRHDIVYAKEDKAHPWVKITRINPPPYQRAHTCYKWAEWMCDSTLELNFETFEWYQTCLLRGKSEVAKPRAWFASLADLLEAALLSVVGTKRERRDAVWLLCFYPNLVWLFRKAFQEGFKSGHLLDKVFFSWCIIYSINKFKLMRVGVSYALCITLSHRTFFLLKSSPRRV